MEKNLEDRIQRAVELFMQGYGCCQSVVCAFSDLYGLDEEMALRISAGFGGGVGRMRLMCGTCSALVILAGLEKGQTRGEDREGKAACYQLVRELLETFRQRNGSINCAELLQMSGLKAETNTSQPDERNAEYYRVRPCARKVESAARVFAEYLASSETSQKEGK
jgi:C_GCAxxG_C_C family probable redox protein